MEGRQVVTIILQDIENFFDNKTNYKIKYKFASRHSACVKIGEDSLIIIDENIANFEVASLADLMLVMLEVCHEAAHYLNRHSIYASSDEELKTLEDKSLEDLADFFGAKLIMTLILSGAQIRPLSKEIGYDGLASLVVALNDALRRFYNSRYKESDESSSYDSRDSRVGFCVAGINSVLDRAGGVNLERSRAVFLGLHIGTDVLNAPKGSQQSYMQDTQSIHRARDIMRELQGIETSMFAGMDTLSVALLGGDSYQVSEEARARYIAERVQQYRDQGLFD